MRWSDPVPVLPARCCVHDITGIVMIGSPRDRTRPSRSVTKSVWPWLWGCEAVRAPGVRWTTATFTGGVLVRLDHAVDSETAGEPVCGALEDGLAKLLRSIHERFTRAAPVPESKKRGDEAGQLAWRLWQVRPDFCYLLGPGHREALQCGYEPLTLSPVGMLPTAGALGLDHRPPRPVRPPELA